MTSPIGVAAFAFRDFIKYVLPTTIALALFVPLFNQSISLDHIFVVALIIGYVCSILIGTLYEKLIRSVHKDRRIAENDRFLQLNKASWDLKKLTVLLTKDESESIYLTESYATFYLLISAYFLAYGITMAGITAYGVCVSPFLDFSDSLWTIVRQYAQTIIGLKIPSLFLGVLSFIFAKVGLDAYLMENYALYAVYYPALAEKYHRNGCMMAKAIWGTVTVSNPILSDMPQPVADTAVEILDSSGRVLRQVTTDKKGAFLFKGILPELVETDLAFKLPAYPDRPPTSIFMARDQIPAVSLWTT